MSGAGEAAVEQTDVGSYFVANYPPFSVWNAAAVTEARQALNTPAAADRALGLYLHIPFCRKRCHFCYFRVYTDKNAREVEQYLDLLAREWELYAATPAVAGRNFNFVYFGGGTPSFLSTKQLAGTRRAPERERRVEPRRRDHVRMRAGHHHRSQARRHPRAGRDTPQPRRRKLRRSRPRVERTRASIAGDRPVV